MRIQLYGDLVIFCIFLFIKSLCTSLGPCQSTFSVLGITAWQEWWHRGMSTSSFLNFSPFFLLDLVKKLHKAVPGSVPALREVSAGWPAAHVEGFPNTWSLSWHLQAIVAQPSSWHVGRELCHGWKESCWFNCWFYFWPFHPVLNTGVALIHFTI